MATNQTDTTRTLKKHVSIRKYQPDPIPDDMLLAILRAARRSPTSSNLQTYSIVVVKEPETKKKLAVLAGNQSQVETCPVFLAICADISRLGQACEKHGGKLAVNLELSMVSMVDAALVGMSASTAAESFGLGTVMIGGIRNDPEEAAQLLGLPEGAFVLFGLCMGWPDEQPPQKPRLPEKAIIHYERYGDTGDVLESYDRELAEHYRGQGRETPDAAWTGVIARNISAPRRPFQKEVLEKRGFNFD